MPAMPARPSPLPAADYAALASFRRTLRLFLNFSADAARGVGLTPQQHQALLALKAAAQPLHVGELAARLHLRHHSAVGLVDRLEKRGLVRRRASTADRRSVEVRITARGEELIARLSAAHRAELRRVGPELSRLLTEIVSS
jgi:DNA-binding MarR family transcriptional regulator